MSNWSRDEEQNREANQAERSGDHLEAPGEGRETLDEQSAGAAARRAEDPLNLNPIQGMAAPLGSDVTPGVPVTPGAVNPEMINPPPGDAGNGSHDRQWRWEGRTRRNPGAATVAVIAVVSAIIGSMITMMLFPYVSSYFAPRPQLPEPKGGTGITQTALPGGTAPAIYVSQKVGPAVVTIINRQQGGDFFGRTQQQVTGGSGVIIDPNGYIVTNNHVVASTAGLTVTLSDGRSLSARVIGADPASDLAVIKVEAINLPTAAFGDSDKLQVGEAAIAIGNPVDPQAFQRTVTEGIISGLNRKVDQGERIMTLIQTDAAINPGNSGGPLCNAAGEVIGINVAKISESQNVEGIGLAIPANVARPIINELISKGKIARVWLGTRLAEKDAAAAYYGVQLSQGLLVVDVLQNSPAKAAGIQPGDIINKVDGQAVNASSELKTILDGKRPGQQMKVDLTRKGGAVSVTVTLAEQPDSIGQ